MNPTNEKVLVTGAGGFIGSHLVAALVENGASVRAFVRYNSRNDVGMLNDLESAVLSEVEICFGDFEDLRDICDLRLLLYFFPVGDSTCCSKSSASSL